jgi:hypothetical protein
VERGIGTLLKARARDAFQSFPSRLAYEIVTGTRAPTVSAAALQDLHT